MLMIILTLHILVASVMSIAIVGVLGAGYRQKETTFYQTMLGSFGLTVVSGVGLLFVTAGNLGRICAMMSVFTLSVIVVRAYYRKQLALSTSL